MRFRGLIRKGFPCGFSRRIVGLLFDVEDLVTFHGRYLFRSFQEGGIFNVGLVQLHKLYIIFHIRRLIMLYLAFVQESS